MSADTYPRAGQDRAPLSELHQLPWGQWCLKSDKNLPGRAVALESISIERLGYIKFFQGLRKGALVIDCGAFIGDTAVEFMRMGYEVHAFEPFPDSAECCRRNVAIELKVPGMIPATVYECAVGNGERVKILHQASFAAQDSPNYGTRAMMICEEGTPSTRLDDVFLPTNNRVDMIKIDVEGMEEFVISGATEIIKRWKPRMYVEAYNSAANWFNSSVVSVFKQVKALGYKVRMDGGMPRWDWACYPQ